MRFLLPVRSAFALIANIRSTTAMSAVAPQDDCTAANKDSVSATGCYAATATVLCTPSVTLFGHLIDGRCW